MKKVIITTRSYDHAIGGMETHTRALANYLSTHDYEVHVLCPELKKGSDPTFKGSGKIKITRIARLPNVYTKYSIGYWLAARKFLLRNHDQYDLIINVSMSAFGLCFFARKINNKVLSIFHGTYHLERKTLLRTFHTSPSLIKFLGIIYTYIFDVIQLILANKSKLNVVVSQRIAADLNSYYHIHNDKILVINNFVDTDICPVPQTLDT